LKISRHGTAYTAASPEKMHGLTKYAILLDLETASDGLGSLEKIFGFILSQEEKNFFLGQWKDGMEFNVRTERFPGGMKIGADGVLTKDTRTTCVLVYDGLTMHFYANGKLVRIDNRGPLTFSNWSKEYPLVIGTDAGGRSQWRGRLFQIAMWDRALSSTEIGAVTSDAVKRRGFGLPDSGFGANEGNQASGFRLPEEKARKQENPPVSPTGRSAAVTGDQWPVTSEGTKTVAVVSG
jgi:hypothetical protein